ncbi:hypothetical protein GQ53DRAFT_671039 [Thozetella sp. PMI_491]|nr:hypothetical protein GQ53DRAFT_671039 [Thozetella sp. PMI_491]
MARKRKDDAPIKLKQPDRSGPTEQTLLQLAEDRDLFELARKKEAKNKRKAESKGADEDEDEDADDATISPTAEHIMECLLWTVSLAILHATFDMLVQHQYAMQIEWDSIAIRAIQAFFVFFMLFYVLHLQPSNPTFVPTALVPARFQPVLRQIIFTILSVTAGCRLIYITNKYSYMAVLKQAPSLGCLWIWSVIELDLLWAAPSLAIIALFVWQGDYKVRL